jgi:hypothetical protein
LSLTKSVITVLWAGFILWTIRKLWQSPKDPELVKYDLAAKFYGLAMTLGSAIIFPVEVVLPGVPFWLEALVCGVIAFPVSLWVGYAISRVFLAMDR